MTLKEFEKRWLTINTGQFFYPNVVCKWYKMKFNEFLALTAKYDELLNNWQRSINK